MKRMFENLTGLLEPWPSLAPRQISVDSGTSPGAAIAIEGGGVLRGGTPGFSGALSLLWVHEPSARSIF